MKGIKEERLANFQVISKWRVERPRSCDGLQCRPFSGSARSWRVIISHRVSAVVDLYAGRGSVECIWGIRKGHGGRENPTKKDKKKKKRKKNKRTRARDKNGGWGRNEKGINRRRRNKENLKKSQKEKKKNGRRKVEE